MTPPAPPPPETFVSVDVETSGPTPAQYSLLSIGACLVDDPARTFYVELRPIGPAATDEAMVIHGLDLERLQREGAEPAEAMARFEAWLRAELPAGALPVFVGFNAAFDWMFVADYFQRFLGRNPFGHTALDIKSYALGIHGGNWCDTTRQALARRYPDHQHLTHHAVQDAIDQAALFRKLRSTRPST
jgi:DNA polymerase III epsilon subunit-like protein